MVTTIMTVEIELEARTRLVVLREIHQGRFFGQSQLGGLDVRLTLVQPDPKIAACAGLLEILIGVSEAGKLGIMDTISAEENFMISLKVGTERTVQVKAPAFSTFPGQPKVEKTTFPVKLRIVTLPHKSRAKPKLR